MRRYNEADLQDLHEYLSNPNVVKYEPYKPMTLEQTKENLVWRLLESLGFRKEAHFKQNVYFRKDEAGKPIWKDTFVYGLLNDES